MVHNLSHPRHDNIMTKSELNIQDPRRVAICLSNLGVILHKSNKLEEAAERYRTALEVIKESISCAIKIHKPQGNSDLSGASTDDSRKHDFDTRDMPTVSLKETDGDHADIIAGEEPQILSHPLIIASLESLATEQDDQDQQVAVIILHNMALIQFQYGDLEKSSALFVTALSLLPYEVDVRSISALACIAIHYNLGIIRHNQGKLDEAIQLLIETAQLGFDSWGAHLVVAITLSKLGGVFVTGGNIKGAFVAFEAASNIFSRVPVQVEGVGPNCQEGNAAASA